ncbi:hypothetical protein EV715DRAFT_208083 [Schizophyllum commune]
MTFPYPGSYYTFHLDPVASLQDIEDQAVIKAARELPTKVYVASTIDNTGAPQPPPAYGVATISLVQQGLPTDIPGEVWESRMSRTDVRIRTENRPIDPPHSLGPAERVALVSALRDDEERRECLRDCAAKGSPPPPAALSGRALATARVADREISNTPHWQIMEAKAEANRLACGDADSVYSDATSHSDEGDYDASSSGSAHTGVDAEDGPAKDALVANGVAEVEDDILAALMYRADLGNTSPVIVPLSYDLSTMSAPPSPAGFMEELDAIKKIRSDYEERVRKLKQEVQRRDDEYIADIQARRVAETPVQSKWPLLGGFVPLTNKVKARLGAFEDEEVAEAARRISPQIYVASTIMTIGAPQLPPAYEVATIALVQQGLPPDKPEEFLESRMCVPIRPNTRHPEGRRPAHCCHPLPWDDCYHVSLHSTRVRVRTDCRDEEPPHSLSSSECVVLLYMLQDDDQRRALLRDCAAKGIAPPSPAPSDLTLACIRGADSDLSDVPYWQILAAERAERLAQPPLQLHVEIDEYWDAETDYTDASDYSDGGDAGLGNPPAPDTTQSGNEAHESAAAMGLIPEADDASDVDNDLLAVFTHRADLRDVSPVIVPLSYDLSTLAAPPSPTGFMEELSAIRKIRADYEERIRRLKNEVRRRDDDYYTAAIEAHYAEGRSAQYKGPDSLSMPFTMKMKARLGAYMGQIRRPSTDSVDSSISALQDIDDEEVAKAAREIEPGIYVACAYAHHSNPQYIALVQQGLPSDDPAQFFESRMCTPIRPNTQHPEGRRPAHCCYPLPWDDCYHVSLHRAYVWIRKEVLEINNPAHSLGPGESLALNHLLRDDEERRECLRDCAAKGLTPPPASVSEGTLLSMKYADRDLCDTPYWQILDAEIEAQDRVWAAQGIFLTDDACSDGGSRDTSASDPTHADDDEQDARSTDSIDADDPANVENMHRSLVLRAEHGTVAPVIVPLSYDLSSLDAPPSPAGFMEELHTIKKIRSDYEERVRQLKDEIRRRDDEYYTAAIEAHRIEARPTQLRWPVPSSLVPVFRRIKARLRTSNALPCLLFTHAGSSVSAPYIRIPCQDLAV